MQLSRLPRRSHTDCVCQLKAYPLEVKTVKASPYIEACQATELCMGEDSVFFLSFQNKIFPLLFLKFTPDLDLLNQKCQSASRLTQATSHSRRLIHIC